MKHEKRKEQKQKKRKERVRREKHAERSQLQRARKVDFDGWEDNDFEDLPPMPSRFMMERFHRMVAKTIEQRALSTEEEISAALNEMTFSKIQELSKAVYEDPTELAQELAYQSMETDDEEEALELAGQALTFDPDCVDARMTAAMLTCSSQARLIEAVRKAVEVGERSLGAEFFQEHRGHFWGMVETRPYMRARAELAMLLHEAGQVAEAIRHYEEMLELNPNDNQGLRDTLVGWYLRQDNLEGARGVMERYPEDCSPVFSWARVLERFLSGDQQAAVESLQEARRGNPHVEGYLTGQEQIPTKESAYTRWVGKAKRFIVPSS